MDIRGNFVTSEDDAINVDHIAAVDTDTYGRHIVILDCGVTVGITPEMHRRIMTAIYK